MIVVAKRIHSGIPNFLNIVSFLVSLWKGIAELILSVKEHMVWCIVFVVCSFLQV